MSTENKNLEQVLWDSANVMRQTMGAADYMDYALGLSFTSICRTRPWKRRRRS